MDEWILPYLLWAWTWHHGLCGDKCQANLIWKNAHDRLWLEKMRTDSDWRRWGPKSFRVFQVLMYLNIPKCCFINTLISFLKKILFLWNKNNNICFTNITHFPFFLGHSVYIKQVSYSLHQKTWWKSCCCILNPFLIN